MHKLPTPTPTPTPARSFTRRYGVLICSLCQLSEAYCKCGTAPATDDEGATDGDGSDLAARIRAHRGRR